MAYISPTIFNKLAEESGESTTRKYEFSEIHIREWTPQININKWHGTLADR